MAAWLMKHRNDIAIMVWRCCFVDVAMVSTQPSTCSAFYVLCSSFPLAFFCCRHWVCHMVKVPLCRASSKVTFHKIIFHLSTYSVTQKSQNNRIVSPSRKHTRQSVSQHKEGKELSDHVIHVNIMQSRSDELQIYIDDSSLQECNCHIFWMPNSNKLYFLSEAQDTKLREGILQELRYNFNRQKLPEVSKIYVILSGIFRVRLAF